MRTTKKDNENRSQFKFAPLAFEMSKINPYTFISSFSVCTDSR